MGASSAQYEGSEKGSTAVEASLKLSFDEFEFLLSVVESAEEKTAFAEYLAELTGHRFPPTQKLC
jgi:hypothetical protein